MNQWRIYAAMALTSALGCGGDDGGSTVKSLDIPSSKLVVDFGEDDLTKFCEWKNELIRSSPSITEEQLCTVSAMISTAETDRCESLRDECLEEGPREGILLLEETDCSELSLSDLPAECEMTAGELETCIRDMNKVDHNQASRASCEGLSGETMGYAIPDSCDRFYFDCEILL